MTQVAVPRPAVPDTDEFTVGTEHWHKLDDGRIECTVCPRHCRLREGQRGFCFVRARQDDQIVLTSYGRSSGFCIDPIEKKPLNHFIPGTPVLSFGTAGCNLGCRFCQNWDISKSREIDTLTSSAFPRDLASTARELDCASLAFTYNDPTIFTEYAHDTSRAAHDLGLKSVVVSAGYIEPGAREELYRHADAANIDLKGFTEHFYKKIAFGNLRTVLDTLEYLVHETDVWTEITTLLIPDHNDGDEEIREESRWIRDNLGPDVPLHFTAFHPDFKMMDVPPTPPSTLRRARDIALGEGLNFVYTGNVHDVEGQTTYCPSCGTAVIVRDWYRILAYELEPGGDCRHCGHTLPGRFDPPAGFDLPGTWGQRRRPVRISAAPTDRA
ncbi:AmmeMemoRadiSam system radical SAM enzyme [Salininema proteolyticum]|uniref:AmmeMemoRadiSam system radical SAM enzyme n=1 Tax=Salininema proteolyticum TaxID=1607685 RepID=A0ABV8U148_9ACTN